MLRYLPGIIIIQVATAALLLAATRTSDQQLWIAIACLALVVTAVTALWFDSIAGHLRKDAVIKARDDFSREREKLRVNAERAKTRLLKQSHEQINKETNRAHAKANFKVGGAFAGVIAFGTLMVFTQFMTLGLLVLAAGGGALGGYLVRLKQERPGNNGAVEKVVAEAPATQKTLKAPASTSDQG